MTHSRGFRAVGFSCQSGREGMRHGIQGPEVDGSVLYDSYLLNSHFFTSVFSAIPLLLQSKPLTLTTFTCLEKTYLLEF